MRLLFKYNRHVAQSISPILIKVYISLSNDCNKLKYFWKIWIFPRDNQCSDIVAYRVYNKYIPI